MRGLKSWIAGFVLAACTMIFAPSMAQAHDWDRHRDRDGVRVVVRGGYDFDDYAPARRPPGWERGRKVGWGGCDLPPGQAKKYGCYGTRYRYDDDDGYRYHQRRPSTVIIFSIH